MKTSAGRSVVDEDSMYVPDWEERWKQLLFLKSSEQWGYTLTLAEQDEYRKLHRKALNR